MYNLVISITLATKTPTVFFLNHGLVFGKAINSQDFLKSFSGKVLKIFDFFRITGIFNCLETSRFVLDSLNFLEKPIILRKSIAQFGFLVIPEGFLIKTIEVFGNLFIIF